jgi:hypothetical protein
LRPKAAGDHLKTIDFIFGQFIDDQGSVVFVASDAARSLAALTA